ncbi:unnamed protein product [Caenorhabditis brenneri]
MSIFLDQSNTHRLSNHLAELSKTVKTHNLDRYTTWPMFARDIGPDSGSALSTQNLYGVHPFYMCIESDGKAHGVFILNSNAQEVETGPGPHLVYRTIGGRIDMAFFPGPTPEEVVNQYLQHIGFPFLPAYWALGYQLCRWGYGSLDAMKTVISRNQALGIPLDVPYADIDYMNHYEDFTEGDNWSGFPAYTQQLHSQGLHLIVIFDPAVEVDYASFQRGINQDASFIEWARDDQVPHSIQDQYPMAKNTRIMLGNVWPERNTAFPDFLDTKNNTNNWWALPFDGMWIDMNEPSNFDTGTYSSMEEQLATSKLSCPISGADASLEIPPYPTQAVYQRSGEYLFSKTLCMLGKTARRSRNFYDTKNLYGWMISRSTFPSSGRYGGHWLGDNTARWEDLQTSVIGVMEFNMFGIPYVGSDICGFNGVSNEELCLRWHQFGAFSPFSRDHNSEGMPDQDRAVWPSVANAAKIALSFRYYYLPFLYSLHYNAARYGHTVIRPLFFEFPKDEETLTISEQFLWGSALMIAPALYQGQTSVHAYFPSDTWYSLQPETYGKRMFAGFNDVSAPLASLTPVFVRGGFILPRQAANTTTTASRLNPFEVLITVKTNAASSGELYYDGRDDLIPNDDIEQHPRVHWQFSFTSSVVGGVFTGNCETCSTSVKPPTLDTIEILGYPSSPNFTGFKLDGASVSLDMSKTFYDASTQRDALFIEWARDGQVPHNIQDQYPMAKNTRVMLGNVWPERNTAFLDFLDTKNNTNNWWAGEFVTFHKTTSVIGVMEFNMFGIPYVGSDICGFNGVSNEELCLRWHQFGAFSPFSRDHNSEGMPDQDPAVWPSVANAAKIALSFRYYYLPFLYSLHYNAARYGHTVIRPLFFEFPKDEETLTISEQFLWGSALMIAPALYQGQTSVHAYFPSDTWYSLKPETYGKKMFAGFNDVSAPLASLTPVFVRGGFILPRQAANTTTTASRLNPFEVLITVKTNAASSESYPELSLVPSIATFYVEHKKQVHWQFSFTSPVVGGVFTGNCETCSTTVKPPTLDTIEILGYPSSPNFTGFKLDGASVSLDMSKTFYDASTQRVMISSKNLISLMALKKKFTLSFSNY